MKHSVFSLIASVVLCLAITNSFGLTLTQEHYYKEQVKTLKQSNRQLQSQVAQLKNAVQTLMASNADLTDQHIVETQQLQTMQKALMNNQLLADYNAQALPSLGRVLGKNSHAMVRCLNQEDCHLGDSMNITPLDKVPPSLLSVQGISNLLSIQQFAPAIIASFVLIGFIIFAVAALVIFAFVLKARKQHNDIDNQASEDLNLARAFIEMGDMDQAREALTRVKRTGTREQKIAAKQLQKQL